MADESNGLCHKVYFDNYYCTISYKPIDFILSQILPDSCISDSLKQSILKTYKNKMYFDMIYNTNEKELTHGLAKSYADYSELLRRSSFRMAEYIYMISEKDTSLLMDAYTTNFYGLAAATHMLLVFNEPQKPYKEFSLSIRDITGREAQRQIKFSPADINNLPIVDYCKK